MKILITGGSGFIGTNLIDVLIANKYDVMNIDVVMPKKESHNSYWRQCDILDKNSLLSYFFHFKPTHVIHLAARTDTEGKRTLGDYRVNYDGTKNVLDSINECRTISHVIITSTQFVHLVSDCVPQNDEDYAPYTVYGESKVIAEKLTRDAKLSCNWTIIRPTNIWGPWHPRYPFEFWKALSKKIYVHPGKEPVIRSYGYVGNVVAQILKIFECEKEKVHQKVFYVGDRPINIYDWVNGFSRWQLGRDVVIVPRSVVKGLAIIGDIASLFHLRFPISSSRFKSMTTSNRAPMEKTFECLGLPPYSIDDGIRETVNWMKIYYPKLVKVQ